MPDKLPAIQLAATIVSHNNHDVLMVRKIFNNRAIIRNIVLQMLEKGSFKFIGEVIFIDRNRAILKLKETKLI